MGGGRIQFDFYEMDLIWSDGNLNEKINKNCCFNGNVAAIGGTLLQKQTGSIDLPCFRRKVTWKKENNQQVAND